jgi:hypothetical protein
MQEVLILRCLARLKDVDEEYVVRVWVSRSKVVAETRLLPHQDNRAAAAAAAGAAGGASDGRGEDGGVAELTERVERLRVKHRPKQESRKRHLKQILIRGDSVVIASPVT